MRPHYNISLPQEFNHWLDPWDERFGPYAVNQAAREITVDLEELALHNAWFVSWLNEHGLDVYYTRVFRSRPNVWYHLHRDVDPTRPDVELMRRTGQLQNIYDRVVKINLIFNSQGSQMQWYRERDGQQIQPRSNSNGYVSMTYEMSQVDVIYTADCDTHCLINGGEIHTLINTENNGEPRICYSVFLKRQDSTDITWHEAVDLFQPLLK